MEKPDYINNYLFDWNILDVILEGRSAFDLKSFMAPFARTGSD